jgi:hypothetical protein
LQTLWWDVNWLFSLLICQLFDTSLSDWSQSETYPSEPESSINSIILSLISLSFWTGSCFFWNVCGNL